MNDSPAFCLAHPNRALVGILDNGSAYRSESATRIDKPVVRTAAPRSDEFPMPLKFSYEPWAHSYVGLEYETERRGLSADSSAITAYPIVHLNGSATPFRKLRLLAEADYGKSGGGSLFEWTAKLLIEFNSKWQLGLGYSF